MPFWRTGAMISRQACGNSSCFTLSGTSLPKIVMRIVGRLHLGGRSEDYQTSKLESGIALRVPRMEKSWR